MKSAHVLILAGLICLMFAPALSEGNRLRVFNPGFEETKKGQPAYWQVVTTATNPTTQGESTFCHSGRFSLAIHHAAPFETCVQSKEVSLQIGQPYRLCAWIKTEKALADPCSQYPTAVAAAIRMSSMPFTEHSQAVAATQDWQPISLSFFATRKLDNIELVVGGNGFATGRVWFDDITLEKVQDIREMIPLQTVRWFGPAFRYSDKGWLFVHLEGEPFQRGYQYGILLAQEIVAFIDKLAIRADAANPQAAWSQKRQMADALMLRGYEEEYLIEMRGIADGIHQAGVTWQGRDLDLVDIVTLNSDVDLGQLPSALNKTTHALSGRSFNQEEEELRAQEKLHKCSSFLANGQATRDGKIVFGQLFMWGGYTGVHWNVLCDVVPAQGHRLIYETFPGGLHSGADFYINQAGIMIGETTVMQTAFESSGTPQSNRIRKAAQYAASIDEVVSILSQRNNGLYTNDWLIADRKTNEIAILLLGTKSQKLWRSGKRDFPGDTDGFLWSVNNAKDPEVRKEYVTDGRNAPVDINYSNSNRDLAFYQWYEKEKGAIDEMQAARFLATSPINRPHACDGKVTTSDMAEQLMFWAHYGKVTLREKFPQPNSRSMPDLANAIPHLTLGYSAVNPIHIAEQLKKWQTKEETKKTSAMEPDLNRVKDYYQFEKKWLWNNTVYSATAADQWFVSATAAYWNILSQLPAATQKARVYLRDQLAESNNRLLFNISREGRLIPLAAERRYDRNSDYLSPRLRGTFALHQLRLLLGNEKFSRVMNTAHDRFCEKPMATRDFMQTLRQTDAVEAVPWLLQWLERDDLPDLQPQISATQQGDEWQVRLDLSQTNKPYTLIFSVAVESEKEIVFFPVQLRQAKESFTFSLKNQPLRLRLNPGNDVPLSKKNYYVGSNLFDEFHQGRIIYGTRRQVEAQHTLALRYQTVLADAFTETLLPIMQDGACADDDLANGHHIVLGGVADNSITEKMVQRLNIEVGKNYFVWQGKTYGQPEDGLFLAAANPWNDQKAVFLWLANSSLQLYQMTRRNQILPSWALFRDEEILDKGFLEEEGWTRTFTY